MKKGDTFELKSNEDPYKWKVKTNVLQGCSKNCYGPGCFLSFKSVNYIFTFLFRIQFQVAPPTDDDLHIPSVCFVIPAPDTEATELATR